MRDIIAGAIDGTVQPAMAGHDLADNARDLALSTATSSRMNVPSPPAARTISRVSRPSFCAARHHDRRTVLAKRDGGGAADARRRAGDEGDLAFKMIYELIRSARAPMGRKGEARARSLGGGLKGGKGRQVVTSAEQGAAREAKRERQAVGNHRRPAGLPLSRPLIGEMLR